MGQTDERAARRRDARALARRAEQEATGECVWRMRLVNETGECDW